MPAAGRALPSTRRQRTPRPQALERPSLSRAHERPEDVAARPACFFSTHVFPQLMPESCVAETIIPSFISAPIKERERETAECDEGKRNREPRRRPGAAHPTSTTSILPPSTRIQYTQTPTRFDPNAAPRTSPSRSTTPLCSARHRAYARHRMCRQVASSSPSTRSQEMSTTPQPTTTREELIELVVCARVRRNQ